MHHMAQFGVALSQPAHFTPAWLYFVVLYLLLHPKMIDVDL